MSMFTIAGAPTIEEGDMELIFSTTLTSDSNSIDTATLATGFRDLLVSASMKSDRNSEFGAGVKLFYNNDQTLSNYQNIRSMVLNNSVTISSFNNQANMGVVPGFAVSGPGSPGTTAFFGGFTARIFRSESSDRFKMYNVYNNCQSGTTMSHNFLENYAMAYKSSAPITSIQLVCGASSDFVVGSSVNIYGIK